MTENTPHNNHLDNYLLGKLSAADKAAMDAKLAVDSHLQEEMLLQQDIVHALQETRRLELKNRLNSIEVGAGGFSSAVGYQLAAGLALVTLVGTGIYLYFSTPASSSTDLVSDKIELAAQNQLPDYTLPAIPEVVTITQAEIAAAPIPVATEVSIPVQPTATATLKQPDNVTKPFSNKATAEVTETNNKPQPAVQIQKPKLLGDFKDTEFSNGPLPVEAPVDVLSRNRQFSNKSIEVSAQPHEKYNFHYQFFESKLFIFGDFNSKPYEILEINTEGATNYYLFFENNYYGLKTDQQKLTKLRRITNEKLVKELEITRSQK